MNGAWIMRSCFSCIIIFFELTVLMAQTPESKSQDMIIDPDNSQAIESFIGEVVMVKGTVNKIRTGINAPIMISNKGKIITGDIVKVDKASVIKIKMIDDTVIALGPDSQMEFTKYSFKTKEDRKSVYTFLRGEIRSHFPVKSKEGDITFKTKTTSMGIRGTTFLVNSELTKSGEEIVDYVLLEGQIQIENNITKKISDLLPGMQYVLSSKEGNVRSEDQGQLSPDELKELQALELDELKDLKPFLPKYIKDRFNKLVKNDDSNLNVSRSPASIEEGTRSKESGIPAWKRNLNKLNTRLRENKR